MFRLVAIALVPLLRRKLLLRSRTTMWALFSNCESAFAPLSVMPFPHNLIDDSLTGFGVASITASIPISPSPMHPNVRFVRFSKLRKDFPILSILW